MNFADFIKKAKITLREDAGSEGYSYKLKFKGNLPECDCFKVEKKEADEATIIFAYPRDYGFALQTLKDCGIEIVGLELLY